jgi:hypothetical protein
VYSRCGDNEGTLASVIRAGPSMHQPVPAKKSHCHPNQENCPQTFILEEHI